MRKCDELTNPASCMSRARDDEWTFVLLGRDAAAPATIRFWAAERVRLGKNQPTDPQIVEAMNCADSMEAGRPADVPTNGVARVGTRGAADTWPNTQEA